MAISPRFLGTDLEYLGFKVFLNLFLPVFSLPQPGLQQAQITCCHDAEADGRRRNLVREMGVNDDAWNFFTPCIIYFLLSCPGKSLCINKIGFPLPVIAFRKAELFEQRWPMKAAELQLPG